MIAPQPKVLVTCDERQFPLGANESTYIQLGAKHRLENSGDAPLRLIEAQSDSYLGEGDIARFEDTHDRAAGKEVGLTAVSEIFRICAGRQRGLKAAHDTDLFH